MCVCVHVYQPDFISEYREVMCSNFATENQTVHHFSRGVDIESVESSSYLHVLEASSRYFLELFPLDFHVFH